tara:strand:+ start:239 stop:553 length:315 start_codon:yes stop_codon:yes gene_type:complete
MAFTIKSSGSHLRPVLQKIPDNTAQTVLAITLANAQPLSLQLGPIPALQHGTAPDYRLSMLAKPAHNAGHLTQIPQYRQHQSKTPVAATKVLKIPDIRCIWRGP